MPSVKDLTLSRTKASLPDAIVLSRRSEWLRAQTIDIPSAKDLTLSKTKAHLPDAEGMDDLPRSLRLSNTKAVERVEKIWNCAQQAQRMADEADELHSLAKQLCAKQAKRKFSHAKTESPLTEEIDSAPIVKHVRVDAKLPTDSVLPIEGHMFKRNSCLRACVAGRWSSRFFRLDGSRLLWWRQKTLTCMPAAGCIDLLADEVEVHVLEGGAFELRPRSGIWKTSKLTGGRRLGTRGGVVFDAIDSELSLQQWVNLLRAHGARHCVRSTA